MINSHHHGRRDALATDITNTEEQFLITDKIVVQVTTHLAGRHQRTIYFHFLRQLSIIHHQLSIFTGQHALLYLAGHMQFRTDAVFLGIHLMQTFQIAL